MSNRSIVRPFTKGYPNSPDSESQLISPSGTDEAALDHRFVNREESSEGVALESRCRFEVEASGESSNTGTPVGATLVLRSSVEAVATGVSVCVSRGMTGFLMRKVCLDEEATASKSEISARVLSLRQPEGGAGVLT